MATSATEYCSCVLYEASTLEPFRRSGSQEPCIADVPSNTPFERKAARKITHHPDVLGEAALRGRSTQDQLLLTRASSQVGNYEWLKLRLSPVEDSRTLDVAPRIFSCTAVTDEDQLSAFAAQGFE